MAVTEECCGKTSSIGTGMLPGGADGLLRVEQGLGGRLLRSDVAVVDHVLEVTDLLVDVEAQPRRAGEVIDLALDAQVVFGALSVRPHDLLVPVRIPVELAIVYAGHFLPEAKGRLSPAPHEQKPHE